MTVTADRDIVSIGQFACRVQCSVRVIEAAADALGVAPAYRINGVPYFDGEQAEKLTAHLSENRK